MDSLDESILEYLRYRNLHNVANQFENDIGSVETGSQDKTEKEALIGRLMNAILASDYTKALLLWDSCIIQHIEHKTKAVQMEGFIAEFLMHLYCTSFIFRPETVKNYRSPGEIAKVAARAMTIFKHYTETRGSKVLLLDEYSKYKVLHKIAFPPTHPAFSHLFKKEWIDSARERIVAFLHQFYEIDASVPPPPLLQMFLDRQQQAKDQKATFKKRERKLMQFARSIYEISMELTDHLEKEACGRDSAGAVGFDPILGLPRPQRCTSRSTYLGSAGATADGRPGPVTVTAEQYVAEVRAKLADYQAVLEPSQGQGRSRDPSPNKAANLLSNGNSPSSSGYPSPTAGKKGPASGSTTTAPSPDPIVEPVPRRPEPMVPASVPVPAEAAAQPPAEPASSGSRQGSRSRSRASSAIARAREEAAAVEAAAAAATAAGQNAVVAAEADDDGADVESPVQRTAPPPQPADAGDNSSGSSGNGTQSKPGSVSGAKSKPGSAAGLGSEAEAEKPGVLPPVSATELGMDLGLCIVGSSKPKPGSSGSAAGGGGSRPITGTDSKPPQILSF